MERRLSDGNDGVSTDDEQPKRNKNAGLSNQASGQPGSRVTSPTFGSMTLKPQSQRTIDLRLFQEENWTDSVWVLLQIT